MEQIFILTPRDRRSAAFFWLGVAVFPVFWSWFTLGKKFESRQRYPAMGWMMVASATFAFTWPQMAEQYDLLLLGLPLLSLLVTLVLCVWLAIRALTLLDWLFVYIAAGGIVQMQFDRLVAHAVEQDFSWKWAALPLAPAFLHLMGSVLLGQHPRTEGDAGNKTDP